MLIRSQDKKSIVNLDNVTQIMICILPCCDNEHSIIGNGSAMGTYSTEEKAIKVLDMIQDKYGTYMCVENAFEGIQGYYDMPKVFQMPADSEV